MYHYSTYLLAHSALLKIPPPPINFETSFFGNELKNYDELTVTFYIQPKKFVLDTHMHTLLFILLAHYDIYMHLFI